MLLPIPDEDNVRADVIRARLKIESEASLGWAYLLPSEASNVIVKYAPKWTISCVIPRTEKKIIANHHTYHKWDAAAPKLCTKILDIKTPDLIWSHAFKKPWDSYSRVTPYFSLFAIDLQQDNGIYAIPYRIANVYSSGTVCFGEAAEIANLRQANNYFWSSPFNQDNCPYTEIHRKTCNYRNHEWFDHSEDTYCGEEECDECDGGEYTCRCECCVNICGCKCDCSMEEEFFKWVSLYHKRIITSQFVKKNNFFCGAKYFACPRPTKAVFISNNHKLLETIPKSSWRRDYKNTDVVIGVASKNYNEWEIDLGSFQFKLSKDKVRMV